MPAKLRDPGFDSADGIRAHLLSGYLPAVYAARESSEDVRYESAQRFEVDQAERWLDPRRPRRTRTPPGSLGLQLGCGAAVDNRGAIAYDTTGFDPTTAVRATAQAVLGLGAPPLGAVVSGGSVPVAQELVCP